MSYNAEQRCYVHITLHTPQAAPHLTSAIWCHTNAYFVEILPNTLCLLGGTRITFKSKNIKMTWKTRKAARKILKTTKARLNKNVKATCALGGIAISIAAVAIMASDIRGQSRLNSAVAEVQKGRRLDHNSAVACSDELKKGIYQNCSTATQRRMAPWSYTYWEYSTCL